MFLFKKYFVLKIIYGGKFKKKIVTNYEQRLQKITMQAKFIGMVMFQEYISF